MRRKLPSLPMANWMYSADYVDEVRNGGFFVSVDQIRV
jgi:hypothetical protein